MSSFIKIVLVFAAGFLLCQYTHEAEAQTVQVTDNRGYSMGTVQINGNTAQFVNPMGYTTQTATIYPNQVVITDSSNRSITAVKPSYTIPPSPLTPMSPRVMQ